MVDKDLVTNFFKELQDNICSALEEVESATFQEDPWERPGGGGGRTRVLQYGSIIEKGGVNFSAVHGELPDNIASALNLNANSFYATGVSIVMHPVSPMVPIIHMNVRYFEMDKGTCWFGGGIDLTPHYVVKEDAAFFHETLKSVCDKHDPAYYSKFKQWADDYFYIKHRKESRGVGGIFFDRLSADENHSLEDRFQFVKEVGESFAPIYTELIRRNESLAYGEQEKEWQMIRRSRYVEFNLVYDKGTKFGLDTDGRIESILMSLPLHTGWPYNYTPKEGSREAETTSLLRKGVEWA